METFMIISTIILSLAISYIILRLICFYIGSQKAHKSIDKKSAWFAFLSAPCVFLMYLIASIASDVKISVLYVLTLIKSTLNMYSYELNSTVLKPILEKYPFYYTVLILAYIMTLTAELFGFFVLFHLMIQNKKQLRKKKKDNSDIVLGYSPEGVQYSKINGSIMWLSESDTENKKKLIRDGITVLALPLTKDNMKKLMCSGVHHFILFRDAGFHSMEQIGLFTKARNECGKTAFLHIEAQPEEMRIINDRFIAEAKDERAAAFIYAFTKYDIIARNFVWDYPISKYVPRYFYNPNFTLTPNPETGIDRSINVVFIGYGKVNKALFKLMSTQFQFVKETDGVLSSSSVNYYFYEKELSHTYDETLYKAGAGFDNIFENCEESLRPEPICKVSSPKNADVFSDKMFEELIAYVNNDSFTYYVISLSDDLSDMSFAQRLHTDLNRICSNYKIFVRTSKAETTPPSSDNDPIIYFGNDETYLKHDSIVNEEIVKFARFVNDSYNKIQNDSDAKVIEWNNRPAIEIESNISNALSLKFKLNLMGLDMVDKDNSSKRVEAVEFCSYYKPCCGDYFGTLSSNVLAYSEHLRWNALYIYSDYLPMNISEISFSDSGSNDEYGRKILKARHKDNLKKKHICLTSYYALRDIAQKEAELANKQPDVGTVYSEVTQSSTCNSPAHYVNRIYNYDYMLLDNVYEKINEYGYKIIRL